MLMLKLDKSYAVWLFLPSRRTITTVLHGGEGRQGSGGFYSGRRVQGKGGEKPRRCVP